MASYEAAKALLKRGVSRPTLYSVQLPQSFVDRETNDYLNYFATSTAIPAVSTPTIFVSGHENMGVVREQPVGMVFQKPFNMTVIENSDFTVYKELRSWLDRTARGSNQMFDRNIRMQYYDTYTSDMELVKLEQRTKPKKSKDDDDVFDNSLYKETLRIKFINAYPINISDIQLSGSDYDAYTWYTVDFSYESYSVSGPGHESGDIFGGSNWVSVIRSLINLF